MPSAKKSKEAIEWAIKLLQDADEDREYDRRRSAQQRGVADEVGYEPTKDAEDLVKAATDELNDMADQRSTPEFEQRFIEIWEGVLSDPAASNAKGFVAKAFGEAILHGPKTAWSHFQKEHDRLVEQARGYIKAQMAGGSAAEAGQPAQRT